MLAKLESSHEEKKVSYESMDSRNRTLIKWGVNAEEFILVNMCIEVKVCGMLCM